LFANVYTNKFEAELKIPFGKLKLPHTGPKAKNQTANKFELPSVLLPLKGVLNYLIAEARSNSSVGLRAQVGEALEDRVKENCH